MINPKAEAFKQEQPVPAALSQYQKEQLAIQRNRERLKAERLARESDIRQGASFCDGAPRRSEAVASRR